MTLDGFAMSVHVLVAFISLMMAAVLHAGLVQMSRATTVQQLRPWPPVIRRLEPLLPVAAVALLLSGIWLIAISHGEFEWTDGWILTGIVSLVVAEGVGGMLAPRSKALQSAIAGASDGPVDISLRRRAIDPALFYGAHFDTAVFLGVVVIMVAKPSGPVSVLTVVIAAVVGLATAMPIVRRRPAAATASRDAEDIVAGSAR
jgi:hypothetical protein